MARSRTRRAAKPRTKKDWVYNDMAYTNVESTVVPGQANAIAFPLTISQTARRMQVWGVDNAAPSLTDYMSQAAIPQGGAQRVYAAECTVFIRPSGWAVGNFFRIGARLMIAHMDPIDGTMLQDPNYGLWNGFGAQTTAAQWANVGYLKETYKYETFDSNNAGWQLRLNWYSRAGRRLGNQDALFLLLEVSNTAPGGSIQCIVVPRCRALQNVDS